MKTVWKIGLSGLAITAALSWVACSSTPTSSKLQGTVAQDTFDSPVTELIVSADDGSTRRVAVASDGAFELVLDEGKTYQVTLRSEGQQTPLVFAGAHGKYVTSLAVPSGGAEANIGQVRFYVNSGMFTRSNVVGATGHCVDGTFDGTDEPCIAGDADNDCTDDDDGDSDSDSDGDSDFDSDDDDEGPDGENVGEQHDDDGDDIEGPVAVPTGGITTLGCDDDDGDSDSDSDGDDDD